jgi:hypothetical protein
MLEVLTGVGLSASAGLNAWIPLLTIGLLDRYTNLITLPHPWAWLANGWVLVILGVLLAIEFVADKVPVVDHVNDAVHTFIRPTAGGLAFGASSESQTVTVSDPSTLLSHHQWAPIAAGAAIALAMHLMKAAARPVINATTLGAGAPVASVLEDIASLGMSLIAIIIPILVIVCLAIIVLIMWRAIRRLRRRRARKAAERGMSVGRQPPPQG